MKYKIYLLNLKLRKLQVWRRRRLAFKAIWIVWEMAWKIGWIYKVLHTGIINSTYTEMGVIAWEIVIWKNIRKLICHKEVNRCQLYWKRHKDCIMKKINKKILDKKFEIKLLWKRDYVELFYRHCLPSEKPRQSPLCRSLILTWLCMKAIHSRATFTVEYNVFWPALDW